MSDDLKTEVIYDFDKFGMIEHTAIDDVDFSDDSVQISYGKVVRSIM